MGARRQFHNGVQGTGYPGSACHTLHDKMYNPKSLYFLEPQFPLQKSEGKKSPIQRLFCEDKMRSYIKFLSPVLTHSKHSKSIIILMNIIQIYKLMSMRKYHISLYSLDHLSM